MIPPLPIMLDIGNVVFFLANFPQIVTAYRNRKKLGGLSGTYLFFILLGCVFFTIGNYSVGATIAPILCIINMVFYTVQLYWKWKYRTRRNRQSEGVFDAWIRENYKEKEFDIRDAGW